MSLNVDTDACNSINRKLMLHNLKFICPIIATYIINCYATPSRLFIVAGGEILSRKGTTYIINCYATPSRLFIVAGGEILSRKGTTQGERATMGAYILDILPLIKSLLGFINLNKMIRK